MIVHRSAAGGRQTETKRVGTGSVGATSTATVTVTWDTPFPDTNYTPVVSVLRDVQGEDLRVLRVRTKTASAITVAVINNALGAQTGTIHAIAVAD